mmetsp:Transcript_106839/g.312299  ORF Transcript_106839/g.312299 Transcript_106839/m.312299 type:complete len:221 (-) Transcript_106839:293-955(-)
MYSRRKSTKLDMPVMALHMWRVRTNHQLCAALSSSMALVSLQRWANRVSDSTLPRVRARQIGATGRSSTPRKATMVSRSITRQCLGGESIGDIASLMNVERRFDGLPAFVLLTPLRNLTELLASTARQSNAPKEVVKTRTCSQARMPHQLAQQAHSLTNLSSKPASTHKVARAGADALAACTYLSFVRAASASRTSPPAEACEAKHSSCSAISFCRARLG